MESRSRDQGTAQAIGEVGNGSGAATPDGYAINVGAGSSFATRVFRVAVTATSNDTVAEVETLVSRVAPGSSSY